MDEGKRQELLEELSTLMAEEGSDSQFTDALVSYLGKTPEEKIEVIKLRDQMTFWFQPTADQACDPKGATHVFRSVAPVGKFSDQEHLQVAAGLFVALVTCGIDCIEAGIDTLVYDDGKSGEGAAVYVNSTDEELQKAVASASTYRVGE